MGLGLVATTSSELERLFVDHLAVIENVVVCIARRHGLDASERDELDAEVKARFVADGYAALARFRGESSLASYLAVVVNRMFLDQRRARWGKWRPSAAARRLGGVAVRFEELRVRDGFDFAEACSALRQNRGIEVADAQLVEIERQLPLRTSRRAQDLESVADVLVAPDLDPEQRLLAREEQDEEQRMIEALDSHIARLSPEDRLIVRYVLDGATLAEIARTLRLAQRPLYRRWERIEAQLGRGLQQAGFDREKMRAYFRRTAAPAMAP